MGTKPDWCYALDAKPRQPLKRVYIMATTVDDARDIAGAFIMNGIPFECCGRFISVQGAVSARVNMVLTATLAASRYKYTVYPNEVRSVSGK